MNKTKSIFNLVGLLLIIIALMPNINIPNINPIPVNPINLDVDKPTEDIMNIVSPIAKIIINKDDRTKLAVFNYSFSKRIDKYDVDSQKINDIYVLAAEYFFNDSIRGKYENLPEKLESLFKNAVGEDNHIITNDEKVALKNIFSGLAWSLIQ